MSECIFCTEKVLKVGEVPVALCCGHVFHDRCIKKWYNNKGKKECPTCKQTQQQATFKAKDGVIRLFLDASYPSPMKSVGGSASEDLVDLTDGDGALPASSAVEDVFLLRHNLLHTQRELEDTRHELSNAIVSSSCLQQALKVGDDRLRSLSAQLQATESSVRKGEIELLKRGSEIRDLKQRIASEQEELCQARSLKSAIDAHQLEKEGYHDQAIDRLVKHCKGEELLVQLKKMLKYRHERFAKLEENASDLKREIQALKAAESQRRKREEMLETSNTLLRQKLDKARASAHMPQEDDANSSLGVQTSTPRSGGAVSEEMSRSVLQSRASPPDMHTAEGSMSGRSVLQECNPVPERHSRGRLMGASSSASGHLVSAARVTSRVLGMGSLMGTSKGGPSFMSNHPDQGGRYVRSGPDGMGGTVHVCVQAEQPTKKIRMSLSERPLVCTDARSVVCNPLGMLPGGGKRPNTATVKHKGHENNKKRSVSDISSFFCKKTTAGCDQALQPHS